MNKRLYALSLGWIACSLTVCAGGGEEVPQIYYIQNDLAVQIPACPMKLATNAPAEGTKAVGKIMVQTGTKYQTMAGIGAAFSEIGTLALATLPEDGRKDVIASLFDEKNGAGLSFCRLPVGSSDFATNAYSYAETPDDYAMTSFSLARDEKSIIPAARQALKVNPSLQFFASPWSPPGWMKLSGTMDKAGPRSRLKDEDRIYKAYALYFSKYLRGYDKAGIPISRLCPQNEADMNPRYPGCVMEPPQMIKLVGQYLAPQFKEDRITTEIWPGTFRESARAPWAAECMKDETFRRAAAGLGIQYYSKQMVEKLAAAYPGLRLMHTEAKCEDGKNTSSQARKRYVEMIGSFKDGCDIYSYWNMILDENQKSGWGWAQNSLVTINTTTHEIRYNPDYQPVYLVSHFVRPGSVRVESRYTGMDSRKYTPALCAFVKGDTVVILVQNITPGALPVDLDVDGKVSRVLLPAKSDCVVLCRKGK